MKATTKNLTGIILILLAGFAFGQNYTEDFEDGDVSEWQQFRANEEMIQAIDMANAPAALPTGGSKVGLIQDVDGSYTGAAILLLGTTEDKDYMVEADVYVYENHASGSAYTGIVAYADSNLNYYVKMVADFDANNRFRIYNNKLDFSLPTFYTFYNEVDASGVDKTEGWHHMKILVTTKEDSTVSYQCRYDETELGTFIDSTYIKPEFTHSTALSGQAGIFAFQQDADGIEGYFDNVIVQPAGGSSIHGNKNLPVSMTLNQNYPNPFNPSTSISFDIHESGNVALQVYNVKGEVIRTLASGYIQPGSYELSWDGKNTLGQKVAAGAYLLVLNKGHEQLSRSMLMVK
ncbi:MAG: T9SS type A sorting domain-containing protein [Candidatus Marinimicrobia bacterium]|nr:T9SS type A sorting domain-containing protein [Candidatus Neomarinimicrobiota bacterium]